MLIGKNGVIWEISILFVFAILALFTQTKAKSNLEILDNSYTAPQLKTENEEGPAPFLEYQIYQDTIIEDPDIVAPVYRGYGSYAALFEKHGVCEKLLNGEIDEVWLWAGNGDGVKHGHFPEWTTTGPGWDEVFIDAPDCGKVISTVTFNFTREINLHPYGHRLEGLFRKHVPCDFSTETWPWDGTVADDIMWCGELLSNRYGFVARPHADNDYVSGCGDTHFPPNIRSGGGYEYGNLATENTMCPDWSQDGSGEIVEVNCEAWGCSERGYFIWWMQNFPGFDNTNRNRSGEIHPNWWEFLFGGKYANEIPTPTPTNTATSTPTDTPTSTPTDTPTSTPTDTPTSTPTDTPTSTPTDTLASTPTDTPASTSTNTPTSTPTNTSGPTPTITPDSVTVLDEFTYLPSVLKSGSIMNSVEINGRSIFNHTATLPDDGVPEGGMRYSGVNTAVSTNNQEAMHKPVVLVIYLSAYAENGAPIYPIEIQVDEIIHQIRRATTYHGYKYAPVEPVLTASFEGQDGAGYAGSDCEAGTVNDNIHIHLTGIKEYNMVSNIRIIEKNNMGVWANSCVFGSTWMIHVEKFAHGERDLYFKPYRNAPDGTIYEITVDYENGLSEKVLVEGTAVFP